MNNDPTLDNAITVTTVVKITYTMDGYLRDHGIPKDVDFEAEHALPSAMERYADDDVSFELISSEIEVTGAPMDDATEKELAAVARKHMRTVTIRRLR